MRYTLKIYPAGRGREIYRTIEISGKDTLDRLCEFILESFDFIHEHLYEFCRTIGCIAKTVMNMILRMEARQRI